MSTPDSPHFSKVHPLADFITTIRKGHDQKVSLRLLAPKGAPRNDKRWHGVNTAPVSVEALATTPVADITANICDVAKKDGISRPESMGVFYVCNPGGHEDRDITSFSEVFGESDTASIEDQHAKLDSFPLQTTARVNTAKSVHAHWRLTPGSCTDVEDWRYLQRAIAAYLQGDRSLINPARVMRLVDFPHTTIGTDNGGDDYVIHSQAVNCVQLADVEYTPAEMIEALKSVGAINDDGTINDPRDVKAPASTAQSGRRIIAKVISFDPALRHKLHAMREQGLKVKKSVGLYAPELGISFDTR